MNILFLHRNYPAQFRHLLNHFRNRFRCKVAFITNNEKAKDAKILLGSYRLHKVPSPQAHEYLQFIEESVLNAQAAARTALQLKKKGFIPDIILGHSWGPISFMKDIFPDVPLVGYFEWFYRSEGSDVDFAMNKEPDIEIKARTRMRNAHILVDLCTADQGIVPTQWQFSQFPHEFKEKLHLLHDGIDTGFFKPTHIGKGFDLYDKGLSIPPGTEIVTYAARGLEPYRGFPQFMKAIEILLDNRPNCHVVIMGKDNVYYGPKLKDRKTFKEAMLQGCRVDSSRVHFTGFLSYPQYLEVLRASWVHVYLTFPFVLSWSMLEAMSTGCLLVASDTSPVAEVIEDGRNGLLVNFFSPDKISSKIEHALDHAADLHEMRKAARDTILERYDLKKCLNNQIDLLQSLVARKHSSLFDTLKAKFL